MVSEFLVYSPITIKEVAFFEEFDKMMEFLKTVQDCEVLSQLNAIGMACVKANSQACKTIEEAGYNVAPNSTVSLCSSSS
jgi:hypothetical protein